MGNDTNIDDEQKKKHYAMALIVDGKEVLASMREDAQKPLRNYISNNSTFLTDIPKCYTDSLGQAIADFGIRFESLDFKTSNEDVLRQVYENNCYAPRYSIASMFLNKYEFANAAVELTESTFLTSIIENKNSPIYQFYKEVPNEFLSNLLLDDDYSSADSSDTILEVIEDKNVTAEITIQYIKSLDGSSSVDISSTPYECDPYLIDQDVVNPTFKNLLIFLNTNGADERIINFVNTHDISEIESELIHTELENESIFTRDFLLNNELKLEKINKFLAETETVYEEFDVANLSDEVFIILIRAKAIVMNANNYSFVSDNYTSHITEFINSNIPGYCNLIEGHQVQFNEEYALSLMRTHDGFCNDVLKLIPFFSEPLKIDLHFNNAVNEELLKEYSFNSEDENELIALFDSGSDQIKAQISEIFLAAAASNDVEFTEKEAIPPVILYEIITDKNISRKRRVEILCTQISHLDEKTITEYLSKLLLFDYLSVINKDKQWTHVKYIPVDIGLRLGEALKKKGLVKRVNLVNSKTKLRITANNK